MKKMVSIALVLVLMLSFVGCGSSKKESVETTSAGIQADIVFKESTYVTMINDIYNNPDNYLGKTIQIDGMFTSEDFTANGAKFTIMYTARVPAVAEMTVACAVLNSPQRITPIPTTHPKAVMTTAHTRGLK